MSQQERVPAIRNLFEVALFAAIVIADGFGMIPISQTVFLVPLIWLLLRLRAERWAGIGWSLPPGPWQTIALGVAVGLVMELFAVHISTPAISAQFGVEPDYSGFKPIEGNLKMLGLYLALSWTIAAVGEEICFRGFLMQRLAALMGGGRVAWSIGLLLASIFFGWGHTEQGIAGWIQEALSGLLLGLLFLFSGKNLLLPIIAHGVSNTLAFVLIYFGRYPGVGS